MGRGGSEEGWGGKGSLRNDVRVEGKDGSDNEGEKLKEIGWGTDSFIER